MATYLITYDLNREPKNRRPKIVEAIRKIGDWAELSESSYAVVTQQNPQAVYAGLTQFLDENDQLYVIALARPYAGQGLEEVNKWLESCLPAPARF